MGRQRGNDDGAMDFSKMVLVHPLLASFSRITMKRRFNWMPVRFNTVIICRRRIETIRRPICQYMRNSNFLSNVESMEHSYSRWSTVFIRQWIAVAKKSRGPIFVSVITCTCDSILYSYYIISIWRTACIWFLQLFNWNAKPFGRLKQTSCANGWIKKDRF